VSAMGPKSATPSKKSEEALNKLFDSLADPDDPEIIGGKLMLVFPLDFLLRIRVLRSAVCL